MKTIRTLLASLAVIFSATAFAQGNGDMKIIITDQSGAPLEFANAVVSSGGVTSGGGISDKNGILFVRSLRPSSYEVKVTMPSYKAYTKRNITIEAGQTAEVKFKMESTEIPGVEIVDYYEPSPVKKEFSTIKNIDQKIIQNGAFQPGDVKGMVTAFCSSCSEGKGGQLVMRGAREGASQVYVDGEKIYGSSSVPGLSIQQVSILSGGIPAEYGDLSGGAVIITTQDFFSGMQNKINRENEASDKEAFEKKEKAKKEGKLKESKEEIIEEGNGGN